MKINYPNHRKSPVQHKVHKHSRDGKEVTSYERGKGKKKELPRRAVGKPTIKPTGTHGEYAVTVSYEVDASHFGVVKTSNYYDAAKRVLLGSPTGAMPTKVRIVYTK